MISTTNLRTMVSDFVRESVPCHKMDTEVCTVGEIKCMVNNLAELLNHFLDELEEIE